jgi:hypothetical protein
VRCSKHLCETEISTGRYVLEEDRLSGLSVRFVGTLRASSIYPLYPGKEPLGFFGDYAPKKWPFGQLLNGSFDLIRRIGDLDTDLIQSLRSVR